MKFDFSLFSMHVRCHLGSRMEADYQGSERQNFYRCLVFLYLDNDPSKTDGQY